MTFRKDEFKVEGEGVWLSKEALTLWREHYCKLADQNKKNETLRFLYCGSASTLADILKCFDDGRNLEADKGV